MRRVLSKAGDCKSPLDGSHAPDVIDRLTHNVTVTANNLFVYALTVFAFLIPVAKLNHILEYFLLGVVALWLARGACTRRLPLRATPFDLPLVLLLGWILLSTVTATDPGYSLDEWRKTLTRVLLFYFVVNVVKEEGQIRLVLMAIVSGAVTQSALGIGKFLMEGGDLVTMAHRAESLTSSSQWLSTYLVMSLPFILLVTRPLVRPFGRWPADVAGGMALVALLLTHTRAAWAAIVIQLLVLAVLKLTRSGMITAAVSTLATMGLIALLLAAGQWSDRRDDHDLRNPSSMNIRLKTWTFALTEVYAHPVTGIGYGRHSFSKLHPDAEERGYHTHVHNTFLSMAVQAGIPGFAVFLWLFLSILARSFGCWRQAQDEFSGRVSLALLLATSGLMVRLLFDDMFVGTIVYVFWLLVGLKVALDKQSRNARTAS